MYKYIDVATQIVSETPNNVVVSVGVNLEAMNHILALLAQNPKLSVKEIASLLNKSACTIERNLKPLREQGRIQRVGSDKAGHWQIIESQRA